LWPRNRDGKNGRNIYSRQKLMFNGGKGALASFSQGLPVKREKKVSRESQTTGGGPGRKTTRGGSPRFGKKCVGSPKISSHRSKKGSGGVVEGPARSEAGKGHLVSSAVGTFGFFGSRGEEGPRGQKNKTPKYPDDRVFRRRRGIGAAGKARGKSKEPNFAASLVRGKKKKARKTVE